MGWPKLFGGSRKRESGRHSEKLKKPRHSASSNDATDVFPPLRVSLPDDLVGDPHAELAYSLRMVHPKYVKRRPGGWRRFWYRGEEPYFDVFIDIDEEQDEVRWFQFTYRGRVVTWDHKNNSLTTGVTNELSTEAMTYASSKTLAQHAQSDSGFVGLVLDVLQFRTDSPPLIEARSRLRRAAEEQNLCRRETLH